MRKIRVTLLGYITATAAERATLPNPTTACNVVPVEVYRRKKKKKTSNWIAEALSLVLEDLKHNKRRRRRKK